MALDKVRRVVICLLVAFVAYAVFKSPDQSASIVHNIWSILSNGVHQIGTFFDKILNS